LLDVIPFHMAEWIIHQRVRLMWLEKGN
jgi:hypothetical protein